MYKKKKKKKKERKDEKVKAANENNPNSSPILECQAKLSASVLSISTHIKTPIMSGIVTKPTGLQVHPAIVAELTDLTIPQTDGAFR